MAIKIAIVDDNEMVRDHIRSLFENDLRIEIVFEAGDGMEAVRLIREKQPDVLLLDLIMPRMDGLEVLQYINRDASLKKQPAVIVVSAVGQERILDMVFSLGAVYYIMKPFEDKMLIRQVQLLMSGQSMPPVQGPSSQRVSYAYDGLTDSEVEVTHLLHDLGVPPHIKGYQYLRDAVLMVVEAPEIINAVTKTLYPTIATMNNTTPSRVERAIRHAIAVTWQRGNTRLMNDLFSYTIRSGSGKPTNSEFVALLAEKIRLSQKKGA